MSDMPHIRAYLCDECWNKLPHYKVEQVSSQKPMKGPTFMWLEGEFSWTYIALYTLGCMICLATIGYYLILKQERNDTKKNTKRISRNKRNASR